MLGLRFRCVHCLLNSRCGSWGWNRRHIKVVSRCASKVRGAVNDNWSIMGTYNWLISDKMKHVVRLDKSGATRKPAE
jgi:hypothetical protein